MTKFWLIGLTAFAMMTGAALAQNLPSNTTTSTTIVAPPVGTFSSTKSRTIDSNGTQTDKSQTYTSGNGGTSSSTSTQTTTPYVAPYADTTTTTRSTTTTIK